MLAKAVPDVPEPDSVRGGLRYEPKWDGFRGIVTVDGDDVEIGSRGAKPLTRYFPELVEAFRAQFGGRAHPVVLDGEVVLRTGEPGHERLDWEALSQRIHPAASRIAKLSVETPAQFVAFDLLAADGERAHRPALRRAAIPARGPGRRRQRPAVRDPHHARRRPGPSLAREFEGAGLDGVVAKPRIRPYAPGKRTMLKVKHHRTADVVAIGYRVHKSGSGVGSLLVRAVRRRRRTAPGGRRVGVLRQAAARAGRRARARRAPRREREAAHRCRREVAVLVGSRHVVRATRARPSCSRSGTTRWRVTASATPCSSSGGGPTATPGRAASSSSRFRGRTTSESAVLTASMSVFSNLVRQTSNCVEGSGQRHPRWVLTDRSGST